MHMFQYLKFKVSWGHDQLPVVVGQNFHRLPLGLHISCILYQFWIIGHCLQLFLSVLVDQMLPVDVHLFTTPDRVKSLGGLSYLNAPVSHHAV